MATKDTSFFNTVKEKAPLDDFLQEHLGVELIPNGPGRMSAVCPFHEEDTPSFVLYSEDEGGEAWQHWHCYGACAEGGTVIDAVLRSDPSMTSATEAAQYLNELYNLGLEVNSEGFKRWQANIDSNRAEKDRAQAELANPESKAARRAKEYLKNRGYNEETIEHFELGVDIMSTSAGRLSIPLLDKGGHPVSVANRALYDRFACRSCKVDVESKEMVKRHFQQDKAIKKNLPLPYGDTPDSWKSCPHCDAPDKEASVSWLTRQFPKYLFKGEFEKSSLLYHEYGAIKPLIKDDAMRGLYLAEGYPDVWAAWQAGHVSVCAYSGSVLSDEQARKATEAALKADKPVILIPDFDETGQSKLNAGTGVDANIRKLHAQDEKLEVQVIHGLDKLDPPCKDLGEVLEKHGQEKVDDLLQNSRWNAGEWQIRQILEATNSETGENFYSKTKEMELVVEVLTTIRTREALDHLIDVLGEHWNIREEQARKFFYSNISTADSSSSQHLFKDIIQAQIESKAFLSDSNVIPLGFDELDACFPGGGPRPGQLMMMLGKAQPLDAKVLTPTGFMTMGEMTVGQEVVTPDNKVAKVSRVTPQGVRPIYRVTFSDGASTECDKEHLWQVGEFHEKEGQVLTLGEIMEEGLDSRWTVPDALLDGLGPLHERRVRWIESIVRVEDKEAQCIALDNEEKLYITDDYIVTHNSGTGKAQPLNAKILTPDGWKAMGEMTIGQAVVNPDGGISSVIGVFPQGIRDIYTLTFDDGSTSQCDIEHLWKVRKEDGPWQVAELSSFIDDISTSAYFVPGIASEASKQVQTILGVDTTASPKRIASAKMTSKEQAQCIALDSTNKLYITDGLTVTHNTMLASQMLANMADRDVNCIFFSLEQGAGSFYPRLATQALDRPGSEVEELIKNDDPELATVQNLYRNMMLVDNVPTETQEAIKMTPGRVQSIIQEANLVHFEGSPVSVVIIDHLGILDVSDDAPKEIKGSETAAPGHIMKELFMVCKATSVFMIVLQQLPKAVPSGVPFAMDQGFGGSAQTNFCDYIIQIWRPEQQADLDETERLEVEGQYKIALGKNRFGAGTLGHYFFDKSTLRILPPLKIVQPKIEGGMDSDGDDEIMFMAPDTDVTPGGGTPTMSKESGTEVGGTVAGLEALAREKPDPLPRDTQALLDAIGAAEDDATEDPFGSAGIESDDFFDIS